jgi:phosphoribosyl-ATP pyrophosphohydrolase/phosphoribosyl-AMP cyclohydrolase
MIDLDRLDFEKGNGLVTVVAQDAATGSVLMVAHADRKALELTVESGEMHYTSRTRGLWRKGETSGNTQRVVSLTADCDGDTVLAIVEAAGPACHTGAETCFDGVAPPAAIIARLDRVVQQRAVTRGQGQSEEGSYTRRLLDDRNLRLKKLGEEATELAVACTDGDRDRAVEEAADLLYHMVVALRGVGAGFREVETALEKRSSAKAD